MSFRILAGGVRDQTHRHTLSIFFSSLDVSCVYLLVEFKVKDERSAEGLYQEAALGQMDGLKRRGRRSKKKTLN